MRITVCVLCGSEKAYGRRCEACLDQTDEQWATTDAVNAYVDGDIDVDELERRLWVALTDPPKRDHPYLIYR